MPKAKWMSNYDYKKYEKCIQDLKNKKGINRYAVCMDSIKHSRRVRERAIKRLK